MTLPSETLTQKEVVLYYLEAERDQWLGAVARFDYSPNSETKQGVKTTVERLNNLLEEYFDCLMTEGLEATLDGTGV